MQLIVEHENVNRLLGVVGSMSDDYGEQLTLLSYALVIACSHYSIERRQLLQYIGDLYDQSCGVTNMTMH